MIKKVLNISLVIFIFIFIFLVTKHYFSSENVVNTNKSRSLYSSKFIEDIKKLPILKNDTSNIIFYKDDLQQFKKERKKRFWEKLISSSNE